MSTIEQARILQKNTIKRLFSILEEVDKTEREEIIRDWIVRYGPNNPIFEECEEDNCVSVFLLVRNNTVEMWKELYLVGDSFGWDIPKLQFDSIEGTKWWCINFKRPVGARLHYMLSPNDLGTQITSENRAHRYKNFILDERNPLQVNEGLMKHSVIVLPEFNETVDKCNNNPEFTDIYMRNSLSGKRSARFCILGNKKSPEKLLIAHDGAAFVQIMEAHKILKKGIDEGRWPSMAVLTLNSPFSERTREYGGKYGYPEYFKKIIIPTIEHHIGKKFNPEDIILHGSSLGAWGLLDVVSQVNVSKNLILHSCPFWWPDEDHQKYIRDIKDNDDIDINRLYFDVGVYETGRKPMSTYESNKHFAKVVDDKGIEFMAREFLMGHRYNSWAWALPSALDYIIYGEKQYGPLPGRPLDFE